MEVCKYLDSISLSHNLKIYYFRNSLQHHSKCLLPFTSCLQASDVWPFTSSVQLRPQPADYTVCCQGRLWGVHLHCHKQDSWRQCYHHASCLWLVWFYYSMPLWLVPSSCSTVRTLVHVLANISLIFDYMVTVMLIKMIYFRGSRGVFVSRAAECFSGWACICVL